MSGRSPSTLHLPDASAWHGEPNYSPAVATALKAAYYYLSRYPIRLPAAVKAHLIALPHLRWRMCVQQRMNLHYVLARSAVGMGEDQLAPAMLDRALEQSILLHDRRSTAELRYLYAANKHAFMQPQEALGALRASREIIADLRGSRSAAEPRLELKVVTAIGMANFYQARYEEAQRSLDEARRLHDSMTAATAAPGPDWEGLLITWVGALVLRYRGQLEPARLALTRIAAEVDTMPAPGAFARIHNALADVALDLAESAIARGEAHAAEPLLKLAHPHAQKGAAKGAAAFDDGGEMMARLALVRHSQLAASPLDRQDHIAAAVKFGENTDEQPVLALARTAQAHEFLAQGNLPAARDLLLQVIAMSAASEVPFMGEPAKAALQRIGGYEDW
jgi:hypothetical protein